MKTVIIAAGLFCSDFDTDLDLIGVDAGAGYLARNGKKMRLAIGDFDSDNELELIFKHAQETIVLNRRKDDTDLEAAVNWAKSRYEKLLVLGTLGGRLDHEYAALSLLTIRDLPIVFYNYQNKIYRLNQGEYTIKKDGYRFLSFFPLSEGIITITGVDYPLSQRKVNPNDLYLISNEILEKEAKVSIEGSFLVIQSNDQK